MLICVISGILKVLEKKQTYSLGKQDRLKSRKAIDRLFKQGSSFSVFPFRVIFILDNAGSKEVKTGLKAGFSVGAKHFKKAVDRNRIKRLMREAYRLQKTELAAEVGSGKSLLEVFFIYTGNELPDYKTVFEKMGKAIKRLQKEISGSA